MAALGSPEAPFLLEPELERHHYAANVLAARTLVEERASQDGNASLYDIWLGALEAIDDVPAKGHFPEVMRARAWQHKQLQTQLASWAELRHDTVLYAKQSYTGVPACEYPTGYIEPYPELFARVAAFGQETKRRLEAAHLATSEMSAFLEGFAATLHKLEGLARKELGAQPFTADEKKFVKATIDIRGGGSGPPRYDGWYPHLIYGLPDRWDPTIADVHTDPNGGGVLEVAVGDAQLLVAAIDNAGDRATYVGPIYSYFEFTSGERLTDEAWQNQIIAGRLPARPDWTRSFQATTAPQEPGR
jgi:hypothetical protein